MILTPRTEHLIDLALEEDAGLGDLTSRAIFAPDHRSRALIKAKEPLVLCGTEIAARTFTRLDPHIEIERAADDGDTLAAGAPVLRVSGSTVALLTAERTNASAASPPKPAVTPQRSKARVCASSIPARLLRLGARLKNTPCAAAGHTTTAPHSANMC